MERQSTLIRQKIKAFRSQGFHVTVTPGPCPEVEVSDNCRCYLQLGGVQAKRFTLDAVHLARVNCLRLEDAYRLRAYQMLQSHLQMQLPFNEAESQRPNSLSAGASDSPYRSPLRALL